MSGPARWAVALVLGIFGVLVWCGSLGLDWRRYTFVYKSDAPSVSIQDGLDMQTTGQLLPIFVGTLLAALLGRRTGRIVCRVVVLYVAAITVSGLSLSLAELWSPTRTSHEYAFDQVTFRPEFGMYVALIGAVLMLGAAIVVPTGGRAALRGAATDPGGYRALLAGQDRRQRAGTLLGWCTLAALCSAAIGPWWFGVVNATDRGWVADREVTGIWQIGTGVALDSRVGIWQFCLIAIPAGMLLIAVTRSAGRIVFRILTGLVAAVGAGSMIYQRPHTWPGSTVSAARALLSGAHEDAIGACSAPYLMLAGCLGAVVFVCLVPRRGLGLRWPIPPERRSGLVSRHPAGPAVAHIGSKAGGLGR